MTPDFAQTPRPPYYAVIFTCLRRHENPEGYFAATERMLELAKLIPGYLGVESVRDPQGFGMTVSYWENQDAIQAWKLQSEHAPIRERGRWLWYEHFEVRIARVERAYGRRVAA